MDLPSAIATLLAAVGVIAGGYAVVYRSRSAAKAVLIKAEADAVVLKKTADSTAEALLTKSAADAQAVLLEAEARAKGLVLLADAQTIKDIAERNAIITSLAQRADAQERKDDEAAKRESAYIAEISGLRAGIDQLNGQIELLNQQVTGLRHELAISKQPSDTTAADAANVEHKADDAAAAAPIEPSAQETTPPSSEIDSKPQPE